MSGAPKADTGKSRVDLVAPDFIRAVGDVLAFGAKKYEAWSWSKGKEWSRDYGAAMRHLIDWANGEDNDPESGLPHLAHAACDIMFLIVSQRRGLGTDDRKKFAAPPIPGTYTNQWKDARSERPTSLIAGDAEPR